MPDLIRHPVFSGCSGHRRPRGNDFAHVPLITDDLMARHFRHPRAGALLSGINPAINAKPLWPAALEPWVPRGGVAPGGVRRPLSLWRSPAATSLRCSGVGRAAELATRCALRSDSRSEHVTVARLRRARHSPLCFSPPQRSRPPHTARREATVVLLVAPIAGIPPRHCEAPRAGPAAWGRLCGAEQHKGECRRAQRASCSDSPQLFERSAQRVASSAVRPIPEQRREVAAGDRCSEAPRPLGPHAGICREVFECR